MSENINRLAKEVEESLEEVKEYRQGRLSFAYLEYCGCGHNQMAGMSYMKERQCVICKKLIPQGTSYAQS